MLRTVASQGGEVSPPPPPKMFFYRRLTERRLYESGGTGSVYTSRTIYGRPESGNCYMQNGVISTCEFVADDDYVREDTYANGGTEPLASVRHYFHGRPAADMYATLHHFQLYPTETLKGRERQTDVLDGEMVVRSVTNTWVERPRGPVLTSSTTTLSDAGLASTRTFQYDQYNNQSDVYEYGFDGGLIRRTHTEYETAAAYTSATAGAHLRGLPKEHWVSTDAGGLHRDARTVYAYDQGDLTDRPNITGICTYHPGHVCSATGPNGEASTEYTTRGNMTGVTRYADAATSAGAVTVALGYDIAGNVVSTTDARNQTAAVTYGDGVCFGPLCGTPSTNTFAFPVSSKTPKPDPTGTYGLAVELTSSTVYDFHTGLVRSTTDANNQTTTLQYEDAGGNLDPLDRLRAVVRPDGGRTDYEYGDEPGNLYVRTLADLDVARRLKSEQHFDGMGRPYRSFTWEGQDEDNPWLTVDTLYDALGRAWRSSNPYRSAGPGSAVDGGRAGSETTFDALGRVTQVKTTADGALVQMGYKGDRVLVTDQAGRQRISKTDAVGRLTEVWEVTPNDPAKYPGVGSIPPEVTAGLLAAGYGYRTEYLYDVLGNLRRVTQGAQPARVFTYDSLSRLTAAFNPESGTVSYTYDPNGNLATKTDARGVQTTYTYDGLNRNIITHYSGGGTSTPTATRHYDNPAVGANGRGRLWYSVAGTSATGVNGYDALGRVLEQHQNFLTGTTWSADYSVRLEYNLAGGVTRQTYPSGNEVTYGYDAAGRLASFAGELGDDVQRTYADQLAYSEFGGLRQERFGTQTPLYHKRHYNRRGQLFSIRLSTAAWSADQWDWNRGAIVNYYGGNYAWEGDPNTPASADNNGNLRRQQHFVPGDDQISSHTLTQQTYEYDALNRLSWVAEVARASNGVVTDSFRQAYEYDRWGNRTIDAAGTWLGQPSNPPSEFINEAQFDKGELANTNRLYAPSDTAIQDINQRRMRYDAAGNLTYDDYTGKGTRAYDAENRMTAAANNSGGTTHYAYDADGRRVRRMVGTLGEVWQVYGIAGELLAEYAKEATHTQPRKEYGYRGGELLVTAEPASAGWGPAPAFEDDPLVAGQTPVRALHITELRDAINALRGYKGLGAYSWQSTAAAGAPIKADPIAEMRTALDQALGAPAQGYAAGLAQGQLIRAIHIQELRERVLGAWQAGGGGVDIRWLVRDQLGTPRMVADQTGSLAGVSRHDYLPFGEELFAGTGGRTQGYSVADNVRQKFTGYERDDETELDFAQARYYSGIQGRFTSVDRFAGSARSYSPQTWNRYTYSLNNPLRYTDPSGLDPQDGFTFNPCVIGEAGCGPVNMGTVTTVATTDVLPVTELEIITGLSNPIPEQPLPLTGAVLAPLTSSGEGGALGAGVAVGTLGPAAEANPVGLGITAGILGIFTIDLIREIVKAIPDTIPNTPDRAEETVPLWRGGPPESVAYPDALRGIARPRGGHDSPEGHNLMDTASIYTSWTFNPDVARGFASRYGNPGVVLFKRIERSRIVPSPDLFSEQEVLVTGVVTGATVIPAQR